MDRRDMKAAAGVAALALVGGAVLWPMAARLSRLGAERVQLLGRVERADDGAAAVARLEAKLDEVERRSKEETVPIPEDSEVASLMKKLTGELDRLGITEREITTGAPQSGEDVSTMPMSVSMRGDFRSVFEAVRWVESLPRLVRTERLRIGVEDDGRGKSRSGMSGSVKAELLVSVYFAPRTPAATSASSQSGGGKRRSR